MPKPTYADIAEQTATNTADIRALTRDVASIATSMGEMQKSMKEGFDRIAEKREWNWQTVGAIAGIVVLFVYAAKGYVDSVAGGIDLKLGEVETQFYWAGDVDAGERADNARFIQLLWHRVYGEELPAKAPYLRGPQRHSTVGDLSPFLPQ